MDFSKGSHNIYFNLTQETVTRIYVAPHISWDIDIWLYSENSPSAIGHSSLLVFTEEEIQATLAPGSYRYHLIFLGGMSEHIDDQHDDGDKCETITIELAMVPKDRVEYRLNTVPCPNGNSYPLNSTSDLEVDEITGFHFNSSDIFYVHNPTSFTGKVNLFKGWNISLPFIKGSTGLWKIEAALQFDFLTASSLGILLDYHPESIETNLSCSYRDWTPISNECTVGVNELLNHNVLRWVLQPGNYTLWLYDLFAERDVNLTSCVPFTFRLSIDSVPQTEDFLTCEAPRIPETLNTPQYLGNRGYLNFAEDLFVDWTHAPHTIKFTLTQPSFFHAFTGQAKIDIDIKLSRITQNGTATDVISSVKYGGEESIITELPAGNFTFELSYFGAVDVHFCETIFLMIAIAPQTDLVQDSCSTTLPQYPDLSTLSSMSQFGQTNISVPVGSYNFPIARSWVQENILSVDFTITNPSVFRAVVGVNFLLGDVEMKLVSSEAKQTIWATHTRDFLVLDTILDSATYTFLLRTPVIQNPVPALPNFPSCIPYTFLLDVEPVTGSSHSCWEYQTLKSIFSSLLTVNSLHTAHIQSRVLIPPANGVLTSEAVNFTVPVASQFRLYSEPHQVDVDFHLMQGNRVVVSSVKDREEEEIAWELQPNTQYTLTVYFFGRTQFPPEICLLYNIELALAPVASKPQLQGNNVLPATNLIPSPVTGQFNISGTYGFVQHEPLRLSLPFNVTGEYYIRAVISYDFLWANLNVRIKSSEGVVLALGETGYNYNEVGLVQLQPGSYILELYEPSTLTSPMNNSYVEFDMMIVFGLVQAEADQKNSFYTGCADHNLPSHLNNLGYLSSLTNYSVHIARKVLVNPHRASQHVDFTVAEDSVFRIDVPRITTVDVDFNLYPGFYVNGSVLTPIVRGVGIGEESVELVLSAGDYNLEMKYYPYAVLNPSSSQPCLSYPLELAIVPLSSYGNNSDLISGLVCEQEQLPPTTLTPNTNGTGTYVFKHTPKFTHVITFNLSATTVFSFGLRYDFASSGLSFNMVGRYPTGLTDDKIITKTFYDKIGYNHAFINEVLDAGNYTLTIHDPSNFNSTQIKCGRFHVYYTLESNETVIPPSCESDPWPTDLYSADGGSSPYGGPQAPDGTILLYGANFLLPAVQMTHQLLPLRITEDSYLRVFAIAPGNNDVDFYIYKNVNRTFGSLVGFSNGLEDIESGLFFLPAQADEYLIDFNFFKVDQSVPCNYLILQIAVKTADEVEQELLCPAVIPESPPSDLVLSATHAVEIHDTYAFTRQQIDDHTDTRQVFKYQIQLNVRDTTTLEASITFDFLAEDYRLHLLPAPVDGDTTPPPTIAEGMSSATVNQNSENNFRNSLQAHVQPGAYVLEIRQNLRKKSRLLNNTFCEVFDFSLNSMSTPTPHIVSVTPQGGNDLDPTKDLVVAVRFSDAVAYPTSRDLQSYALANNAIILATTTPEGDPMSVSPTAVAFQDSSATVLLAAFSHTSFTPGKTYVLRFDFSNFTTSNGSQYSQAIQSDHEYVMASCDCNGHGTCYNVGSEVRCNCTEPWAGPHCLSCMPGYHGAAGVCVPNVKCSTITCNNHGFCTDTAGYPQCLCTAGYVTVGDSFCSACAPGWDGYPNCTMQPDGTDEGTQCKEPILPDSFNSPGYLGFDGEMHIQDYFYIDVNHRTHEIMFKLDKLSVFRFYAVPHWIDVDAWLYRVNGDVRTFMAHGGLSLNGEETMFEILPASVGDDQYVLKLNYFLFSNARTNCETFNAEIAIAPYDALKQQIDENNAGGRLCGGIPADQTGTFPDVPDPIVVTGDYSFSGKNASSDTRNWYAVKNVGYTPNHTLWGSKAHFVWNTTIQISKVPDGQVAVLRAELGYRFLEGDMGLLLELGGARTHCGSTASSNDPQCTPGFNMYNKHVLDMLLSEGTYTLWIYEPLAQKQNTSSGSSLTECAPYDFHMSVRYVDNTIDTFACRGARLPFSLNAANYLDSSGYLHFQEDFIVAGGYTRTNFDLTKPSLVKLSSTSSDQLTLGYVVSLHSVIRNTTTGTNTTSYISSAVNGFLYTLLQPGSYQFRVSVFDEFIGNNCPRLNLELHILPTEQVNLDNINQFCGTIPEDKLPTLPNPLVLPYSFGFDLNTTNPIPETFTAVSTGLIKSWSFTLTEPYRLKAQLVSSFAFGDLRLELISGSKHNAWGLHKYNMNHLDKELPAGDFTLKIVRPTAAPMDPLYTPSCTPFNFALSLEPSTSTSCSGDEVPLTLDTLRFLNTDNRMNYQSYSFNIPSGLFEKKIITFQPSVPSLFRVYTEPHSVDIDMRLVKVKPDGSGLQQIAAADNGFFNEEVIVALINETDVQYQLELFFWRWGTSGLSSECAVFNMEIALLPEALHVLTPCPNGGAHWPPAIPHMVGIESFLYDSERPTGTAEAGAEILYFQQQTDRVTKTYNFVAMSSVDMYFEVGYDFAVHDLALNLTHRETSEVFIGHNGYNRNFLRLTGMLPGTYDLTIYEPKESRPEALSCAYFTFFAEVVKTNDVLIPDPEHPRPPSTLDSLEYLSYSAHGGSVHLHEEYELFSEKHSSRTVTFTPKTKSLVRVSVQPSSDADEDVTITLRKASDTTPIATGTNSLISVVSTSSSRSTDTYALDFTASSKQSLQSPVYLTTELAVSPVDKGQAKVSGFTSHAPSTCLPPTVSITIPQSGSYLASHDLAWISSSASIVYTLPFHVSQNSILYSQIEYDFLLDEFEMILVSGSTTIYSYDHRNSDVINEVLLPGDYTLTVSQKNRFTELGSYCVPFAFSVAIVPQEHNSGHSDCSGLNAFPYELNSAQGGSAPYGGPISADGFLYLYGERFLASQAQQQIRFNLTTRSDVSVFVAAADRYSTLNAQFVLTDNTNVAVTEPLRALHTYYQRFEVFRLSPRAGGNSYTLDLKFDPLFLSTTSCPYVVLDIEIKPSTVTEDSLACNHNVNVVMPDQQVNVDNNGFAFTNVASVITSSIIAQYTSGGEFTYPIHFTTTKNSMLYSSIAFDGLTNYLELHLKNARGTTSKSSALTVSGQPTGATNTLQELSVYLVPSDYTLTISKPANVSLSSEVSGNLCYDYIYTFRLVTDDGTPYVLVQPAAGVDLSPDTDIVIKLSMSSPIYTADHVQLTYLDADQVGSAFYLNGPGGASLYPSKTSPLSANGKQFELTFSHTALKPSSQYSLAVRPNVLFGTSDRSLIIPQGFIYSTLDTGCGHGTWKDGVCVCSVGYAGSHCDTCDQANGYVDQNANVTSNHELVCVKSGPAKLCTLKTCGCLEPDNAECIPLGECDDSTGVAVCSCHPLYSGDHCEQCIHGYYNYPRCRAPTECNPRCVHGTCNYETNRCTCEANWKGSDTCDKCTDGWTGADCKTPESNNNWETTLSVIKILLIILISVIVLGGIGWFVWLTWFKRKKSYYPLGLEELRGGMELKTAATRLNLGDDDDTEAGDTSVGVYELGFEEDDEDLKEADRMIESGPKNDKVNVNDGDDDDFNPRANVSSDKGSLLDL